MKGQEWQAPPPILSLFVYFQEEGFTVHGLRGQIPPRQERYGNRKPAEHIMPAIGMSVNRKWDQTANPTAYPQVSRKAFPPNASVIAKNLISKEHHPHNLLQSLIPNT